MGMRRVSMLLLLALSLVAAGDPWTENDLVRPEVVAKDIRTPLLLHVGFDVLYRASQYDFDEVAFHKWLDEMQETYDLVGRESYPQVRLKNTGSELCVDYLEIFRFVPKTTAELAACGLAECDH